LQDGREMAPDGLELFAVKGVWINFAEKLCGAIF
jgi:hypothetical protein